jgi:CheY-like chemotaxis protein
MTTNKGNTPAEGPSRTQANPPIRILVVDDDNDARQLSVDVLIDSGYEVESAKDGAVGWAALQANGYDIVITDNQMPKMTGVEMIEKLRAACIKVPVIMATGSLPKQLFERKPWLHPDATLQRPYSNDELVAMVKKVLHRDDSYNAHIKMLLPKYLGME